MKICITATEDNTKSNMDPRFGRAQYFLILNDDGKIEDVINNKSQAAQRGAGISAAQKLGDNEVDILISGNIGPNAFNALSASGIKVFLADASLTVEKAFEKWKSKDLNEVNRANVGGHFGEGRGRGRGQRRGF